VERSLAPKTYNGANAALMACCNTWMHVWAADGSHAGWRTTVQLVAQLHEQLYHAVPPSTAARWLAAEKARYEEGKGVHKKPRDPWCKLRPVSYVKLTVNYSKIQLGLAKLVTFSTRVLSVRGAVQPRP